ncbi:MAG: hypothetical protein P8181_13775 [bacterium]
MTLTAQPELCYMPARSIVVAVVGVGRIRRRGQTPYITAQSMTPTAIEVIAPFPLPEIILPLLCHNGHP